MIFCIIAANNNNNIRTEPLGVATGIAAPGIGVAVGGSFGCVVAASAMRHAIPQCRRLQHIITIILYCIDHGLST